MTLTEALAFLHTNSGPSSDPQFLEACKTVAAHIDELPYRLFFQLPGGLSGNSDPAWDAVKAASHQTCDCGNERFFEPVDLRTDFEPADGEPVTLKVGEKIYFKPAGSTNQSAYSMLELVAEGEHTLLIPTSNPLVENVGALLGFLLGRKGFPLSAIQDYLAKEEQPVMMCPLSSKRDVPIFKIIGVDVDAQTVTFIADAGVEVFTLEPATADVV